MTITQFAAELKISRPTAYKYQREGCPMDDMEAARAWVAARKASDGRGGKRDRGEKGDSAAFFEARLRKLEAEAQMAEFNAEVARGNLVPLDDAKAAISAVLQPLRVLLDAVPRSAAPRANPSDPQLAEDVIRECLETGVYKIMDAERAKPTATTPTTEGAPDAA